MPLPAPCHHLATACPSRWDTHPCWNLHFSLPTPAKAVNITLALSASLQIFHGPIQSSSLSLSKSLLTPSRLGPGLLEGRDSLKTLQYHPDAFCTPLLQHQVPFHTAAVSSWQQISTLDLYFPAQAMPAVLVPGAVQAGEPTLMSGHSLTAISDTSSFCWWLQKRLCYLEKEGGAP